MNARETIRQAARASYHYRYESDGDEHLPHVCVTVDFSELPCGNINLTEPKEYVARTVAERGWGIIRTEPKSPLRDDSVRRVYFGDPSEL